MPRHPGSLVFMFGLIVALLLAACGGGSAGGTDDPVAAGEKIFNNGKNGSTPCFTCHTLDGSELVGPSLQGVAERAGTRLDGVPAEDYLRQSITDPAVYLVEGYTNTMPKDFLDYLSDEDIDNLVAFLLTQ
jgi:mono/diheme cytochrome c family protein